MPAGVKTLYEEAASISGRSPRAAAALLRLAIDELSQAVGAEGRDLNSRIGDLISKGLPAPVRESLDIVRVTGNNAVHPGEIDADDPETVGSLFALINIITEYMVSMPARISGMYQDLPQGAREAIERRDGDRAEPT